MKILVIAPHADDEVLGCGGTIKKHAQEGDDVYLCIVTKGYTPDWTEEFLKNRKKEIGASAKVLGIKEVFFLDFPAVKLDTVPQKDINDKITKCVYEVMPEILYIPHGGDLNKDHQIVFESSLVAARTKPDSCVKKIFSYETLSETEWGHNKIVVGKDIFNKNTDVFLPNVYVDISETLKDKLKAMECYKSELKDFPHPRSLKGITVLAEKRGMEAGLLNAEAFMVVKEIIK